MPRYYHVIRPPSIGCQPDGYKKIESWWPNNRHTVEGLGNWQYYGFVEYDQPLSLEQSWHFTLKPADPVERAHQAFYSDDRAESKWQKNELRYCGYSDEQLQSVIEGGDFHGVAAAALVLKAHGWGSQEVADPEAEAQAQ